MPQSPQCSFESTRKIERLRAGFDSPSRVAPKAEALIRRLAPREEWDRWRVYVAGRLQVNVDDLRNSRFLADNANFAPQRKTAFAQSRHTAGSVEPLSFEREVLSILLEEPVLGAEYGQRIGSARFRNEVYRRHLRKDRGGRRHVSDDGRRLRSLRRGSGNARSFLRRSGDRDRSSAVRYGDTEERRAHLDRSWRD